MGKYEPLFDVIAGTLNRAINGAILLRQFLETQSWEKAVEKLERNLDNTIFKMLGHQRIE